jgi:hypothetical protein
MPENDPSNGQSAEQPFLNSPNAAMDGFLDPSKRSAANVLAAAGQFVRAAYQGFDGEKDALGTCVFLTQRLSNPTTVMAELFAMDSVDLPEHWKNNPEVTRIVLTMSGHVELGYLRANQVAQAHEGGNPHIDARIAEVEGFVSALQEK